METQSPGSPHDRFFRTIFSHRDAAADLIRSTLPASLTSTLDLEHLTVSQDSFVDRQLRSTHSDLLVQVPRTSGSKTPLLLYVLVEHKSAPERWTLLQLLGYLVEIWKRHRRDHPKERKLPVIIPLIFSHAARRWPFALDFASLVALQSEQEQRYTPRFTAALYQTAGRSPEQVQGGARFVAAVRMLHERREFARLLPQLIGQVRDALPHEDQIRELLTAILAYAAQVSPEQCEAMSEAVRTSNYRPAEEAMMTIAEQWKAEGWQKGRVEGETAGKIEDKQFVLTRLLDRKFGLLDDERALITATTDPDKLDAALDAIIDFPDKDSILALLRHRPPV